MSERRLGGSRQRIVRSAQAAAVTILLRAAVAVIITNLIAVNVNPGRLSSRSH